MAIKKSDAPRSATAWSRREALIAGAVATPLLTASPLEANERGAKAVGPYLGHVDHETAILWYRPSEAGRYTATITNGSGGKKESVVATASADHDLCVQWRFENLPSDSDYVYRITQGERVIAEGEHQRFRTAPLPGKPARTVLAMGSCASSREFFDVWTRIEMNRVDGLLLLGDTPYIDNREKSVNRARHREFLSIPTLARLGANTPVWGTWDDHDFGGNDTDGKIGNKRVIRQVFTEYRAQKEYGDGEHGIYTRFRRGPVEVFLLDPRYFSQTEASPVDKEKPTCLGGKQWEWLRDGLKKSTAPFKLLATGMIWDDKKNGEKDDWETYAHEREALFDFIGENNIGGVVLIGGDIHVSRHLKYPMKDRIGYDLHQWIISPLHDRVIPSLNVPHPHLQWGQPLKNMFLTVAADTTGSRPRLEAKWIDRMGKLHRQVRIELEA
ncbi:MAG: alkaline phosphatase D family protein [Planctomycetota bacterium]|nr:alkaline phosphatase D family protein [Planctomycetota bacterium]